MLAAGSLIARDRVYRRLYDVLTGKDTSKTFARLSESDRRSILEILLDTKPNLPGYWADNAGFSDDKYTQLTASAAAEPDAAKRKLIYSQLNDWMTPVAVPVVPSGRTYVLRVPGGLFSKRTDERTPKHYARHGLNRFDGG